MFYGRGINHYNVEGIKTVHAEVSSVLNLKKSDNKRKVYAIVYRTNKTGTSLLNSRPCKNCLSKTYFLTRKKNYVIDRFYFFDENSKLCYYNKKEIDYLI